MFKELVKAVDYLNKGQVEEAGKYLLELAKSEESEELFKLTAEVEKELRELEEEKTLLDVNTKFEEELREVVKRDMSCKREKLRVLSYVMIEKMSKGNDILISMIRNPDSARPHTYI
ncbi:MAG: hypothetical protein ASUL_08414 [Candidatus Aramenus sulfurataquae]|uniref:Uncharacterized protein n=1 Tax=Candidatus Aramenus sulfurataquae TaxID=1326980 RepID=W7KHE6_9CREN|nr:MAG: hypothetical protein ASUL_08414 [Candidatus Aramenus sulfurataquae]MBW9141803.1 hypothetical protein [Candidatus Aramenus sp.]